MNLNEEDAKKKFQQLKSFYGLKELEDALLQSDPPLTMLDKVAGKLNILLNEIKGAKLTHLAYRDVSLQKDCFIFETAKIFLIDDEYKLVVTSGEQIRVYKNGKKVLEKKFFDQIDMVLEGGDYLIYLNNRQFNIILNK